MATKIVRGAASSLPNALAITLAALISGGSIWDPQRREQNLPIAEHALLPATFALKGKIEGLREGERAREREREKMDRD